MACRPRLRISKPTTLKIVANTAVTPAAGRPPKRTRPSSTARWSSEPEDQQGRCPARGRACSASRAASSEGCASRRGRCAAWTRPSAAPGRSGSPSVLSSASPALMASSRLNSMPGLTGSDPLVGLARERAEAAVDVGVARGEQEVEDPGERRVAEPAVQGGDVPVAAAQVAAAGDEVVAVLSSASRNWGIMVKS